VTPRARESESFLFDRGTFGPDRTVVQLSASSKSKPLKINRPICSFLQDNSQNYDAGVNLDLAAEVA